MRLKGFIFNHSTFFLVSFLLILAFGVFYVSLNRDSSFGCCIPGKDDRGEFDFEDKKIVFNNKELNFDLLSLYSEDFLKRAVVLGESSDDRWIEIDLSDQKLYAHNGDNIDYEFLISSGKWGRTPEGEFRVWIKLKYTKMSGGSKALGTYYYLPNVPYVQYFYKGFGLHGTYWHDNFGTPMSHGCINMRTPDAEKLYYWTSPKVENGKNITYPSKGNPGTRIVIHN